ncbi:MAG: FxDxF family PEP-CTERM protein [Rhizobacter sp.]
MQSLPTRLATSAIAAAAIALTAAAPARADPFNLGPVSAAQTCTLANNGLATGWINDIYTFTVAEGTSFDFTGVVSNIFGRNLTGSANLGSTLYSNDPSFVQVAVGSTVPTDSSGFTFERSATYAPTVLGAGEYGLYVTGLIGTGGFAPAVPASYSGQITFGNIAAPVPEPETWALMALGLVGVGAAARRKSRRSA